MGKNLPAMQETGLPSLGSGGRAWQPTPVLLPGGFHGQRSLVDYSPWGRRESDTTECPTLSLFKIILMPRRHMELGGGGGNYDIIRRFG